MIYKRETSSDNIYFIYHGNLNHLTRISPMSCYVCNPHHTMTRINLVQQATIPPCIDTPSRYSPIYNSLLLFSHCPQIYPEYNIMVQYYYVLVWCLSFLRFALILIDECAFNSIVQYFTVFSASNRIKWIDFSSFF